MNNFIYGVKKGIPICLGYLAVSFTFGIMCQTNGLTPLLSVFISLSNLTSSGQFAGVKMILEFASYFEIGLAVLLINLRYSLMSLSLSQKLEKNIPTYQRLLFGFGITDEVFAVAFKEERKLTSSYMFGLILLPIVGWTLGTSLGYFSSTLLSDRLQNAMGIALYAMFIAIIIPDAKKSLSITIVILLSMVLSIIFEYVPYINETPLGFKIVIPTIISALLGAIFFPIKEDVECIN